MDKNKRLLPFRKHPVRDILKGRKTLKKGMGILLAAALLFNTLPSGTLTAVAEDGGTGLCEHHPEHTEECGYAEAAECTHEHTAECYKTVTDCTHTHTEECVLSDTEGYSCAHECSEESGCIRETLDCHHEHDADCGYAEAHECTFVCGECGSGDDADAESLGEIPDEETTEVIKPEDAETNDSSLCSHHKEHTEDCGFVSASEDGEGMPCTYECRICPIEELIAALPDAVTEDNRAGVEAQIQEILDLYRELSEDEQAQLDLTLCYDLLAALDEANTPMPLSTGNVELSTSNLTVTFTAEGCGESCAGHTVTQTGSLQAATIIVESGTHDITFSDLNLKTAKVGVMPGATMNLTIDRTNSISAAMHSAGIYVPVGATLVITEQSTGSLDVSGSGGAGIGGAFVDPSDPYGNELGNLNCGTIVINGGTIIATGGSCCAGIGGADGESSGGNGGVVTINGGTVTATGGGDTGYYGGAGVGGGNCNGKSGSGGALTINGGHVTLDVGTLNSQYGVAYGFGRGNGRNSNVGTLTLADENYLTLANGTTLDPQGTYIINGDPTEDMIVVPENLVYTGNLLDVSGIRIDDSKTGTATYFGQTFKVSASADGWELQDLGNVVNAGTYTAVFKKGDKTISKTFTVVQSGTEFTGDGVAKAYLNGVETTSFTADDTVTVKVTPTATGQAPANAAMKAASLTKPAGGQMALFVGDTQVSEPVDAGTDGIYTMTVKAFDVLELGNVKPNGDAITLTAKFVGNDNMADATATVDVTITAVATVESGGNTTYYGTLQAAVNAAADGTVTLLANVEMESCITINSACTLDMNGHNINCTGNDTGAIYSDKNVSVTVKGNGEVQGVGYAVKIYGGNLILEGGAFRGGVEVHNSFNDSTPGNLTVTGAGVNIDSLLIDDSDNVTVALSAGTYGKILAVRGYLKNLLTNYGQQIGTHYAYYRDDAPVTEGLDSMDGNNPWSIIQNVTVRECKHNADGVTQYQHNNGTETHTLTCLACGYSVTEDCTYDEDNVKSNEDDTHTLTCLVCGSARTEDCSGGTATYTEKAICGLCKQEYGEVLKDTGAPTGEISISTSKWNSFLNTVTFGLFFKDTEKVTITAEDQESGVKSVAYCISDKGMSEEEVKALTAEWKNVDGNTVAFNISGDKSCVVYAKITDNQGNMTYLSSDGMVFDGTTPAITGVENDKTYCEQQTVTVRDDNLESVTVNGEKADLQDGGKELSLTLDAASGVQTIEAKDKAGNTATVKVTLAHTLTHYESRDADCAQAGNVEYWECSVCGKKFSDKDGRTEITDTEIPKAAHTLIHYEGKDADCTQAGNVEFWGCSVCGKKFSDKDGQKEITDADVEIGIKPHTLTHHAGTAAGCLTEGSMEYWDCSVCGGLFSDKDGTTEVSDTKLPATGHKYSDWQSNGNGTHTRTCQMPGCGSTETGDCSGGTATYTEKAVCEICSHEYGELLKDSGAPTGEISIRTSKWISFLNTVTFGLFFKDTEKVTITAEDQESGVKSVAYYISDKGMSEEEVKALEAEWTNVDGDTVTFGISGDRSCVVYAKITDRQGNVAYLSSDGMVFDGTAPAITGVENDKAYCKQQTVTVTDNNLESVTVNGKEVTLSDNKFILDAESGLQMIEAKDKAGNAVTVTVNMGHRYGTGWKSNETQHWHECSNCDARSDIAAHTKDSGTVTKAPTVTEKGIRTYYCSVCGYEMGEEAIDELPSSHTHEFGTDWKTDAENHWHECSGCGAKSDSAAHTKDSGTVTKEPTETEAGIRIYCCSVCGYKMDEEVIDPLLSSHTHNYSTEWTSDSSRHWHECICGSRSDSAAHTKDSGIVTKAPTATEKGIRTYHCSVCGYEMGEEVIDELPPSHTHEFSTDWKKDSGSHWHECICGERLDSAAHTKDSGTVTKKPTETETGIRTYYCSVCGYKMDEEPIEPLPPDHIHNYGTDWKKDSSSHWHECICGEKSDSAAHTKDGGIVTKAPTETETGIRTYHCSVCGYEMCEEVIDKLPTSHTHEFSTDWKKDSSSHWHECICGEKSDSAAHTKDGGIVTKAPTETETGIRTYYCSVCGYKMDEEVIDKLSPSHTHEFSADWKTDSNRHWHECICGEKSDSAAHTKDSGTVTKKPTKTETGIRTYKCTVCGYEWTEKIEKQPSSSEDDNGSGNNGNGDNGQGNNNSNNDENKNNVPETQPTNTPSPAETATPVKPETNTTNPGTGTTKPGNGTNQDKTPQSEKEPFIKGTDGKIGWDVIRAEEEKTEDGNIINVDMNGSAVVPGDIFDRIRGRDITITFDMGNGIIWSVDGKSVTTDRADDIDFSVKMGGNTIPADIVNRVAGERFHTQLSLAHNGDFGFTAVLSINIGRENAGLTASLYYYNESTGELEFISSGEVAEDGTVSLAFTHASDYVAAVGDKAEDGEDSETESSISTDNDSSPAEKEDVREQLPDTDSRTFPWSAVIISILLAVACIVCVIFVVKKKKKDA